MADKKAKKLNDYKPEELEEIKSNTKKLNERVDALAELLGDLEAEVKEIKGKTYPGDIANAIREGIIALTEHRPASVAEQPASAPVSTGFEFDIFSIKWKQKKGSDGKYLPVPAKPAWGWVFSRTQDGGYHKESEKLVKHIERYGPYSVGNQIVKIGGPDNKWLQLSTPKE